MYQLVIECEIKPTSVLFNMNDLDFVKNSLGCINEAFRDFKDSYNTLKFGCRKPISHWHACANRMEEILEEELGFSCYVNVRKDRSHALYEVTFDGAANVPEEHIAESELEITINISPEFYTQQLYIPDETWEQYKEQLTLTFIHELTHSLQLDDGRKTKYDDYFSNPFEIDAYSSELAFDMFLYNKAEKTCESYARYATIDNKIQKQMISLARKKYSYLKNNK